MTEKSVKILWQWDTSLAECTSNTTENCPFWVYTTIEIKTTTTTNYKQQNTIKVNTLKLIPKYYSGDIGVSTFSFVHSSKTYFLLMPLVYSVIGTPDLSLLHRVPMVQQPNAFCAAGAFAVPCFLHVIGLSCGMQGFIRLCHLLNNYSSECTVHIILIGF